jgi:aldose 1-epimerase
VIGAREIDGHRGLTIAGAERELEATFVPGAGMICCSLRHRGEEVLGQRNGLRGYIEQRSTMGIPLLYPWANRLSRDRFEVGGQTVDLGRAGELVKRDGNGLPMHGLLTAFEGWRVSRHESSGGAAALEAELVWSEHPELMAGYPFEHRLGYSAAISAGRLTITTTIDAGNRGPVPIAFGFHPYLAPSGGARESWRIDLPLGDRLPLDDRGLPTGARDAEVPAAGALAERAFDDLYLAPPSGKPLTLSGGGRTVRLALDAGFPFTQLYSPRSVPLLAIEPMTAPTDALTADPGPALVEPGSRFSASFSIEVVTATGSER